MEDYKNVSRKVIELIEKAQKIAVVPSKVSGPDAFCAGVGLYHMLKEKEKNVFLIYTGKIPEGFEDLIKEEEITSDIFERNLAVSIDYSQTPAAKVHYSTENDVLSLKIGPVDKNFRLDRVRSEIKGFEFDLVFTIGASELEDFGQVYHELESEFQRAKIVNIDNTNYNSRFGSVSILDTLSDSLSLLVLQESVLWGLKVGKKAGKALLAGITHREPK
jgi:nanoRNase/pAp phosphatase (c-di-AMP/oligoRNAs hydrolase)